MTLMIFFASSRRCLLLKVPYTNFRRYPNFLTTQCGIGRSIHAKKPARFVQSFRYNTIPACDGHDDSIYRASIASRGKNLPRPTTIATLLPIGQMPIAFTHAPINWPISPHLKCLPHYTFSFQLTIRGAVAEKLDAWTTRSQRL